MSSVGSFFSYKHIHLLKNLETPYLRGVIDKEGLQLNKISFWQCKIITVTSEWNKFISLTHYTLIFQHSHYLRLHIFFSRSIHLFIPSMKKVSGWLLFHLRTAASTLASDKNFGPFNVSFNFGNNQKSDCALEQCLSANSTIFLDHGVHSALVLVASHRNGSSWSELIQDTHLTCTTAFGTPDALADIFHIHTTIAINCVHKPMNFDWRATF